MAEFEQENIATPEVKIVKDLDMFKVMKQSETVSITTIKKFLDAEDNVLRTEDGKNFIYRNTPATETEPECNDFNVFLQQLGLTMQKLKDAVNFMQSR